MVDTAYRQIRITLCHTCQAPAVPDNEKAPAYPAAAINSSSMPIIRIEKKTIYTSVSGVEDIVTIGTDMYAASERFLKHTVTAIGSVNLETFTQPNSLGESMIEHFKATGQYADAINNINKHITLYNRPSIRKRKIEDFFYFDRHVTLRQLEAIQLEEKQAKEERRRQNEEYSSWGEVNPLNFHGGTIAIFKRCSYPDENDFSYYSRSPKSSSEYFGNSEMLVRVSDHWGDFGSYWWFLDEQLGKHVLAWHLWTGHPIAGCVKWKDIRFHGLNEAIRDEIYARFDRGREQGRKIWNTFNAWDFKDVYDLWIAESGRKATG